MKLPVPLGVRTTLNKTHLPLLLGQAAYPPRVPLVLMNPPNCESLQTRRLSSPLKISTCGMHRRFRHNHVTLSSVSRTSNPSQIVTAPGFPSFTMHQSGSCRCVLCFSLVAICPFNHLRYVDLLTILMIFAELPLFVVLTPVSPKLDFFSFFFSPFYLVRLFFPNPCSSYFNSFPLCAGNSNHRFLRHIRFSTENPSGRSSYGPFSRKPAAFPPIPSPVPHSSSSRNGFFSPLTSLVLTCIAARTFGSSWNPFPLLPLFPRHGFFLSVFSPGSSLLLGCLRLTSRNCGCTELLP